MLEPKIIIYGLVDPRTNVVRYVGQSTCGFERPITHRYRVRCDEHNKTHKANWIRSLWAAGVDYEIVVLQYLRDDQSYEDIDNVERWWIAFGNSQGWDLTNATDGGGGIRGYEHTQITKERISKASLALWQTPEYRSEVLASRAARGYTHPPEVCEKIAKGHRGRKRPDLVAYNTSRRGKPGRIQTEEECTKRSISLLGNTNSLGAHRSDEAKKRIAAARRGRPTRFKGDKPKIRINLLPGVNNP